MGNRAALLLALILLAAVCLTLVESHSEAEAAENTWTTKAPMRVARCDLGVAVANSKIYAIGGNSETGYMPSSEGNDYKALGWIKDTNEEYDPATDTWTTKTPMPTPRYGFAIGAIENRIYCIGGKTNWASGLISYTSVNEVYDASTNKWETKESVPNIQLGKANVVKDKIYLIGGGESGTLNQVYDPATDSWTNKTPLPEKVDFQVSAVIDDHIFVIGFWQSLGKEDFKSMNFVYDPETDSWNTAAGLFPQVFKDSGVPWRGAWTSEAAGATSGAHASKRIYVFFMQYVYSGPLPNFVYNPINDTWASGADLPANRQNYGVAVLEDKLFAIGGKFLNYPYPDDNFFTVTPQAVNEQFTPFGYGTPDTSIIALPDRVAPRIAVISPENRTYSSDSVTLVFSVNEPVSEMAYSLDGAENVTVAGNVTLAGLSSCVHNVTVYARDQTGNAGASETVSFSVAEPFPVVPVAVASAVTVALAAAGLLIYRKKHLTKAL